MGAESPKKDKRELRSHSKPIVLLLSPRTADSAQHLHMGVYGQYASAKLSPTKLVRSATRQASALAHLRDYYKNLNKESMIQVCPFMARLKFLFSPFLQHY